MPHYRVSVNYRTMTTANTFRVNVFAPNEDEAYVNARRLLPASRKAVQIDGGDVELMSETVKGTCDD